MTRRIGILAIVLAAGLAATAQAAPSEPVGTVTAAAELPAPLRIPGTTAKALRLTYVTTDAKGQKALSTGELFIPEGTMPRGGWPVISWAHGTSGLGDTCAPSVMGPAEPERDFGYLSRWMKQGYAVVASDYAGLGTDGLPAYLNGRSEAHNVVDMVKAGRAYAHARLGAGEQLSNRWVVIGQSQGGGAAIYTARYATEFGGDGLVYTGAVGTGVPAYIEDAVSLLGPKMPPVALPPGLTAYLTYILASMRAVHPELGLDGILTATGRKYLALSEERCVFDFEKDLPGVSIGDYLTAPLASLPNWSAVVTDYMAMPESGFDKPFFMGHGLVDQDVPFAITAPYVAKLEANRQPLTFKAYPTDHSGALIQSQADSSPFVRKLLAEAGPGPDVSAATTTSLRPARRTRLAGALRRGLLVRVTAPALTPLTITATRGGKVLASADTKTSPDAVATVRLRLSKAARRQLRGERSVRLRLRTAGAARTVVLRR